MKEKYYVDSFYDYCADPPIDYVVIGHATKEMEEHDGYNFVGSSDAARFDIYNSLEEAIRNSHFWAPSIKYDDDLSQDEREIIVTTTNELIFNKEYCEEFPHEMPTEKFTEQDIKSSRIEEQEIVR